MKLSHTDKNIETNGVLGGNAFTIKATGKAFRILSSGLYSDKILAIIRELSCNAWDAHKMNGNPEEPFSIHLPNRLESFFAIRDFGTGLSHDDVINLYTTYFASTKQDSNEFIGALGLGSKSPFSYVDSFTVESYFDGMLRTYTSFIGNDGTPEISLMMEQETTERNGLRITLPVKANDCYDFCSKAEKALRFFPVAPIVTGNSDFELSPINFVLDGSGWGILNDSYASAFGKQGAVVYPIESGNLSQCDAKTRGILAMPIIIDFEMGELDVQASREGLSYDEPTQNNIKERCALIYQEIIDSLKNRFDDCTTIWEAHRRFFELFHDRHGSMGTLFRGMVNDGSLKFVWKGKEINTNDLLIPNHTMPSAKSKQVNGVEIHHRAGFKAYRRPTAIGFSKITVQMYDKDKKDPRNDYSHQGQPYYRIPVEEKTHIYVNDVGTGAIQRMKKHARALGVGVTVYMIDVNNMNKKTKEVCLRLIKGTMKKFQLTDADVTYISATPTKQRQVGGGGTLKGDSVFTWDGDHENVSGYWSKPQPLYKSWDAIDADDLDDYIEEGGIYIDMLNNSPVAHGEGTYQWTGTSFANLLGLVNDAGLFDTRKTPIVGVRKSYQKKFHESDKWVNIFDHVRVLCQAHIDAGIMDKIVTYNENRYMLDDINSVYPIRKSTIDTMKETVNKDSPFVSFLEDFIELESIEKVSHQGIANILKAMRMYDNTVQSNLTERIKTSWEDVQERYPLASMMKNRWANDNQEVTPHIAKYINLVDADNLPKRKKRKSRKAA